MRYFSDEKGVGFIVCDDKDLDFGHDGSVFVHHSAIKSRGYKSLAENEVVEFSIEK